MLPLDMMDRMVAIQMGEGEGAPPPVEEMVASFNELIDRREERLAKIEAAVTDILERRSQASLGVLSGIVDGILLEDPNSACLPQLENIRQAVEDIKKLQSSLLEPVEQSTLKIGQKRVLCTHLQEALVELKQAVKVRGGDPRVQKFYRDLSERGASYAAKWGMG